MTSRLLVVSAVLARDGSYCDVLLSAPTNEAGKFGLFSCGELLLLHSSSFKNETMKDFVCRWVSPRILRILIRKAQISYMISSTSNFSALVSISLRSTTLRPLSDNVTVTLFNKEVAVTRSLNSCAPKVSLAVHVTNCGGLYIDTSASSGSCGWSWSTIHASLYNRSTTVVKVWERGLEVDTTGLVYWNRSTLAMLGSSAYQLNVTLCNVLGNCGQGSLMIAHLSNQYIVARPIVHAYPSGVDIVYTRVGATFVALGRAFYPDCYSNPPQRLSSLNYTWHFVSNNTPVHLAFQSRNPQVFKVPPYNLAAGKTYLLQLTVRDKVTGAVGSGPTLIIECLSSAIVAQLLPAQSEISLSLGGFLSLNASSSYDPDKKGASGMSPNLAFQWECIQGSMSCPLFTQLTSNKTVMTINASFSSAVGSVSKVTVFVSDPSSPKRTASSASVLIRVVREALPLVLIETPLAMLRKINAASSIEVNASVALPFGMNDSVLAEWFLISPSSVFTGRRLGEHTLSIKSSETVGTVLFSLILRSGKTAAFSLKLPAGYLQAAARYTFRLVCNGTRADVAVTTNEPPYGGVIRTLPRSGISLVTIFAVTAIGWSDDVDDYPLSFEFSFWAGNDKGWTTLQGQTQVPSIDAVYLPTGAKNSSYQLLMRVHVFDALGVFANSSLPVRVTPMLLGSTAAFSYLSNLVNNATAISSLAVQQLAITLTTSFQHGDIPLSLNNQRYINAALYKALNSTLHITDEDRIHDVQAQMSSFVGDYKWATRANATIDLAVQDALKGLPQHTNTSNSLDPTQSEAVSKLLSQILLNAFQSNKNSSQTIQIIFDGVRYSLALMKSPNSTGNATVIAFLPTISIPNSQNTINIASPSTNGGSSIVTVIQYDLSSLANSSNSQTAALVQKLLSDVISVKVVLASNASAPVLPNFVANLSISDDGSTDYSGLSTPVFAHNCTIGVKETVLFNCIDSNVLMNLTCSGKAIAVVRRKCPIPRRVCNVLSLRESAVSDGDYCEASQVSGSSVVCRCGFGSKSNASSSSGSVIGPGGSVSVAVMTEYVAGDFSGTVSIAVGVSSADVARESSTIFMVFGCLWGIGGIVMFVHFYAPTDNAIFKNKVQTSEHQFRRDRGRAGKNAVHSIVPVNSTSLHSSDLELDDLQQSLRKYLLLIIPGIFRPTSWFQRLREEFCARHDYIRIALSLLPFSDHEEGSNQARIYRKRKKNILELTQILTAFTMSCFLLAMLYDLQYPNNDGSCSKHVTESTCLQRKSLLDPSQSYCKWVPIVIEPAGVIYESRDGVTLQRIPLVPVLTTEELTTTDTECQYLQSEATPLAGVIAAIITSTVSAFFMRILSALFAIAGARSLKDAETRLLASQAILAQSQMNQLVPAVAPAPHSSDRFNNGALSPDDSGVTRASVASVGRRRAIAPTPASLTSDRPDIPSKSSPQVVPVTPVEASSAATTVRVQYSRRAATVSNTPMISIASVTPVTSSRESEVAISTGQAPVTAWWKFFLFLVRKMFPIGGEEVSQVVPEDVRSARKEFTILFGAIAENPHLPNTHVLAGRGGTQSMSSHRHDHHAPIMPNGSAGRSIAPSVVKSSSKSRWQRKKEAETFDQVAHLREHLKHATDVEYAVALLHTFLGEILGRNTPAARLFFLTVRKDFVDEVPPVSERAQWVALGIIAASNIAGLFFVLLKGIQRGSVWQISFLSACFLQWMMEAVFLQTVEVLWIDFGLPGLVYRDFVQSGLFNLFRLADQMLVAAVEGRRHPGAHVRAHMDGRTSLDSANPLSSSNVVSSVSLSRAESCAEILALDKAYLPESRLVMQGAIKGSLSEQLQVLHNQLSQEQKRGILGTVLTILTTLPLEIQRLMVRFFAPLVLGGVILLWFSLDEVHIGVQGPYLLIIFSALIVGTVVSSVYLSYRHQQLTSQVSLAPLTVTPATVAEPMTSSAEMGDKKEVGLPNRRVARRGSVVTSTMMAATTDVASRRCSTTVREVASYSARSSFASLSMSSYADLRDDSESSGDSSSSSSSGPSESNEGSESAPSGFLPPSSSVNKRDESYQEAKEELKHSSYTDSSSSSGTVSTSSSSSSSSSSSYSSSIEYTSTPPQVLRRRRPSSSSPSSMYNPSSVLFNRSRNNSNSSDHQEDTHRQQRPRLGSNPEDYTLSSESPQKMHRQRSHKYTNNNTNSNVTQMNPPVPALNSVHRALSRPRLESIDEELNDQTPVVAANMHQNAVEDAVDMVSVSELLDEVNPPAGTDGDAQWDSSADSFISFRSYDEDDDMLMDRVRSYAVDYTSTSGRVSSGGSSSSGSMFPVDRLLMRVNKGVLRDHSADVVAGSPWFATRRVTPGSKSDALQFDDDGNLIHGYSQSHSQSLLGQSSSDASFNSQSFTSQSFNSQSQSQLLDDSVDSRLHEPSSRYVAILQEVVGQE